jgi:hypothetical protein
MKSTCFGRGSPQHNAAAAKVSHIARQGPRRRLKHAFRAPSPHPSCVVVRCVRHVLGVPVRLMRMGQCALARALCLFGVDALVGMARSSRSAVFLAYGHSLRHR